MINFRRTVDEFKYNCKDSRQKSRFARWPLFNNTLSYSIISFKMYSSQNNAVMQDAAIHIGMFLVLRRWKEVIGKGKVCIRAKWPTRPELIRISVASSDQEYFYSTLDGMLVHRRDAPSIKLAGSHLYTWVERGTVRVKCGQGSNSDRSLRSRAQ